MVTAEEKLKKMDKKEKALRRVHKLAKEIYIFQRCGIPRKQWKIKTFRTKQTLKVKSDDSHRRLFLVSHCYQMNIISQFCDCCVGGGLCMASQYINALGLIKKIVFFFLI